MKKAEQILERYISYTLGRQEIESYERKDVLDMMKEIAWMGYCESTEVAFKDQFEKWWEESIPEWWGKKANMCQHTWKTNNFMAECIKCGLVISDEI